MLNLLDNIGVFEVAGHAMLYAVTASWMNLVALRHISQVSPNLQIPLRAGSGAAAPVDGYLNLASFATSTSCSGLLMGSTRGHGDSWGLDIC